VHAAAFETPWSTAEFLNLLAGPGVFALMASEDDTPLAFVLARVAADESEILTLAARPESRRRGLARALVNGAGEAARAAGARAMILEVAEDNAAALALYAALGFETVGRRAAYYADAGGRVDARVLRREL
jgi:ribosomal-protein-alanine N-acetyltransferase